LLPGMIAVAWETHYAASGSQNEPADDAQEFNFRNE
jgi:hypothetical protein